MGYYGFEAIALSAAILVALLLQFSHGKPHLKMLWFCLGMASAMTALAAMYFEIVALLSLAPAWTAAVMATVRVRGNWDRLLRWFWAGVLAQIALMVVFVFGFMITMRMGRMSAPFPP